MLLDGCALVPRLAHWCIVVVVKVPRVGGSAEMRPDGRFQFPFVQLLEIYVLEPRVILDVLCAPTLVS